MSNKTVDKGVNLHGDVTDFSASPHTVSSMGIVFKAEANDFAVIMHDPVFGHNGPFGIKTDITN